ncbi:MAG: hypothetical protein ACT4OP_10035 [Actinomycetota bacterium]
MAFVRECRAGRHHYEDDSGIGGRAKCTACGAVQIDLTDSGSSVITDPTRVFAPRKTTLFSLLAHATPEAETSFGKSRHRRS